MNYWLLAASCIISLSLGAAVQPRVTVNTTSINHLDTVRTIFTGLSVNDTTAWLGVFYPASADVSMIAPLKDIASSPPWTATYPIKWIMCSSIEGCLENGGGQLDFILENALVDDVKICMFTGGINTPVLLAESKAISFKDTYTHPFFGHLARSEDVNEMVVAWNAAVADSTAHVRWGYKQGGPYDFSSVPAKMATYTKEDLCGPPATGHGWFSPQFLYTGVITRLDKKDRVVYYIYGSDNMGWSDEESFKPVPYDGVYVDPDSKVFQTVNIGVVADLGMAEYENVTTTVHPEPEASATAQFLSNRIRSGSGYDYSLLLHDGDISYSMGYLVKWVLFMSKIVSTGLGTRVPYMLNQGNHERDYPNSGGGSDLYPTSADSGGECGVPTEMRFPSPTNRSYADSGWYAVVHGPVLIIMLNSEAQVAEGSPQFAFLDSTLAAVDRLVTPWVVVLSHRPMYYVYSKGGTSDPTFRVLEPTLMKYQVDVFVGAHVHNTFISCPLFNSTCVTEPDETGYLAPIHLGIGNGGETLDLVNDLTPPVWMRYQASEHGYSTWSVSATDFAIRYYGDDNSYGDHEVFRYELNLSREYPRRPKK